MTPERAAYIQAVADNCTRIGEAEIVVDTADLRDLLAARERLERVREADKKLKAAWEEMQCQTDGWNWYWMSYGEKCYAFATVTAFLVADEGQLPPSGTRLEMGDREREWIAEDGSRMIIDEQIAAIEQQNGDVICKFIALAYANAQERFGDSLTPPPGETRT